MFRALKWAYDLGVRQERVRISAHLQNRSRQAEFYQATMYDKLRNEKTSDRNKKILDFDMAVERKVQQIIEDIMRPQFDIPGGSLMFPDDKHKGEI